MSQSAITEIIKDVEASSGDECSIVFRKVGRREFLKLTGISVTGLTLAYSISPIAALAQEDGDFKPNGFVQIGDDGVVTLYNKAPEIGQGIKTSFPMTSLILMMVCWQEDFFSKRQAHA